MKYKRFLILLSMIFGIALCYYIGSLTFHIYMNTLWDKSYEETLLPEYRFNYKVREMATIYAEDGFQIPVTMHFFYPDTIVQYAGILNEETKNKDSWIYNNDDIDNRDWLNTWRVDLNKWGKRTRAKFDTIYKVDTLLTRALISKNDTSSWYGANVESRFKTNIFDITQFQPHVKSWASIKPKTAGQYYLLLCRDNLPIFYYLFIFYHLLRSVLILNSNFSFSENLYRRIRVIGWAIMIFEVLQFLLDYSLKYVYDFIVIQSSSTAVNYIEGLKLFMYAEYHLNFEALITGLLLILLSILMKRSSEIEEAWSLTI